MMKADPFHAVEQFAPPFPANAGCVRWDEFQIATELTTELWKQKTSLASMADEEKLQEIKHTAYKPIRQHIDNYGCVTFVHRQILAHESMPTTSY